MQEMLKIVLLIVGLHIVVLVAILFVIRKLLLGDTMRAVERIQQSESEVRKKEEGIRRQIEEHEQEFARLKADAEKDFEKHKQESEKELSTIREQITADAKREAEQILADAKRGEEKFRKDIERDMEEKAVGYAGEVFKLVFSDKVGEEVNRQFTDELFDALEEIDSASITIDGSDAEFTSSHALSDEQKQRLTKILVDKFNVNVNVNERVNGDLLAGVIFKLGSLEIDGSLRNRYHEAVDEVKKEAHA